MESDQFREKYDTGLKRIGHEVKSRLVLHGLFGTVNHREEPNGAALEVHARGRVVVRSFSREQIEGCHLRVAGAVLSGIVALVEELAVAPPPGTPV